MTTRFLLLLALISLLTFSAQAQVSVGASIGANYSFWDWHVKNPFLDVGYTEDPGFGYRAAAVVDWQMNPIVGLRADIAYQVWRSSTDVKLSYPRPGPYNVDGNISERFHNLAGSLLVNITPFRQKRIYFLAGATAAHVTEAWRIFTQEDSGAIPGYTSTSPKDLKYYNRTQVFADFGTGVRFPLGAKGALLTEVRYQLALTNLSSHPNVDAGVNALLLNVGYLFTL